MVSKNALKNQVDIFNYLKDIFENAIFEINSWKFPFICIWH